MEFRPPRTVGTLVGGSIAAWCLIVAVALVVRGLTQDVALAVISLYVVASLFFFLALLFAYWTYSLGTLRYALDRNALTITWGDIRQMVPLSQIERLVPGRELPNPHIAGVSWLGHHVGHAGIDGGIGDTLFYSTHRSPRDLLYVVTPNQSYALSVDDEVAFAEAVQQQQRLGSLVAVPQAPERLYLAAQPFWEDRTAQVLAVAAIATFFVMFGYVYRQYPGLPPSIALSFPQLSGVTRVASKSELLKLPMTGVGLLLLNLGLGFVAHSWERMVGYVLLLAAIGAEGILLAAAIIALR
ncbi:MAG TPA: PH domain-containing protein [Dehalococcoidia bacterium]|nr:PH domain-containing protein [Dehalococcoidia bacterium]